MQSRIEPSSPKSVTCVVDCVVQWLDSSADMSKTHEQGKAHLQPKGVVFCQFLGYVEQQGRF